MAGDIFTLDADNNAVVRTVPVNAAASETNSPVIFTTDEDGNTAVRTVSVNAGASETNSPVIFTTDENGNAAVRVVGAGGGSTPVIDELNVTPSTSAQTITAPSGVDGYSPVNVAAVTSAIDANITAGNIKKDVQILGVTGSYKGQTPTGTKSITANGVYDVTDFASADVQVPTTVPAHYIEKSVDANGKLISSSNFIDLTGVTDIGERALCGQYLGATFPANTIIDMSSLNQISGNSACENMFSSCAGITSVNLSTLNTISGARGCYAMFYGDATIANIDLNALTTISGETACQNMFSFCTATNITFNSLSNITGSNACAYMFSSCFKLKSLSFPALTSSSFGTRVNQFSAMILGATGCTIHFPSNLDPAGGSTVISSMLSYPNFGGTNTVLMFDLPATE